ncbi:hypothetical protein [Robertkochia aurantiaca]|uniref:hypothetical protein n=1 Tax=Robertkochia aurantiaca TaxID=2873700 RepID=UPI001CCF8EA6|nr:hypothetical protein [Robertkochia sp. 3YJGBD-33]
MNSLVNKRSKIAVFLLLAVVFYGMAQEKKSKNYSERFKVNEDVSIDINTAYTDIVLETWNRDEVVVEATITVENVSEEKAKDVFEKWNFSATGNSGKVTINANSPMSWYGAPNVYIHGEKNGDYNFVFEDMDMEIAIPELPPMPPMPEIAVMPAPPMPPIAFDFGELTFDYEAYKKDGEAYMKEWKEKFKENFDEDFQKNMEEWKKRYEEQMKAQEELFKLHEEDRERMQEEREIIIEEQQKLREEQQKMREEQRKAMEEARAEVQKLRTKYIVKRDSTDGNTRIFFIKGEKGKENLRIKRTIRIKAPKGAKLNMNVRHGEVKLAEQFEQIDADLSYTSLIASRIDGEGSVIRANYSPVTVGSWNKGRLMVNYGKKINLTEVQSVKLTSKSSNVIIGTITGDAIIEGSFGDLVINDLGKNFRSVDISLDNSDARIDLPDDVAFDFYCTASDSEVKLPSYLVLDVSDRYNSKLAKGYNKQKNSTRSINLMAELSEVNVQ